MIDERHREKYLLKQGWFKTEKGYDAGWVNPKMIKYKEDWLEMKYTTKEAIIYEAGYEAGMKSGKDEMIIKLN